MLKPDRIKRFEFQSDLEVNAADLKVRPSRCSPDTGTRTRHVVSFASRRRPVFISGLMVEERSAGDYARVFRVRDFDNVTQLLK